MGSGSMNFIFADRKPLRNGTLMRWKEHLYVPFSQYVNHNSLPSLLHSSKILGSVLMFSSMIFCKCSQLNFELSSLKTIIASLLNGQSITPSVDNQLSELA